MLSIQFPIIIIIIIIIIINIRIRVDIASTLPFRVVKRLEHEERRVKWAQCRPQLGDSLVKRIATSF